MYLPIGVIDHQEAVCNHRSRLKRDADVLTPILILNTKFALPRPSAQHVSRPSLLALVEQGVQRLLTLVSAPAGFGKTTLLAE